MKKTNECLLCDVRNNMVEQIKEQLMGEETNPNLQDREGNTALYIACKKGFTGIVKLLLADKRVDVNLKENGATALYAACLNDYEDIVALMLNAGADPNVQDIEGDTPLHAAALYNHKEVAQLLLADKRTKVNTLNDTAETPSQLAQEYNSKEVLELLLHANKGIKLWTQRK